MNEILNIPLFVSTVLGILAWVSHKLWDSSSDTFQQQVDAAIKSMRSIMTTVVLTAKPDATPEWIHDQLVGVAAIQLAHLGIDPKNKLVKALVDDVVNEGLKMFVETHPSRDAALHADLHALLQKKRTAVLAA